MSSIEEVKTKESATETLGRLLKGEIKDEELKKLIKFQFEKRLQWGYKSSYQEQLYFNLEFIKCMHISHFPSNTTYLFSLF